MPATKIKSFSLSIDSHGTNMPLYSNILSVGTAGSDISIWAEIDPDPNLPLVCRHLRAFSTGEEIPYGSARKFLGTVMLYENQLPYHVYEMFP